MTGREERYARLDRIQSQSLARLQQAGADRALIVELLESACLLELAKVDTTRVDPASYLQYAVDVVAQMYPVEGVAATISMVGRDPIEVHAGEHGPCRRRYGLAADGIASGELLVGAPKADLGSPGAFFEAVGQQIAQGFAGVVRAETLRREAAIATAARLAAQLAEEQIVDGLEELALAIASFPGAVASELSIDHAAVGPPLRLRSGFWEHDGQRHSVESVVRDVGASYRISARVRSADSARPDTAAVEDVMACLAGSLDRIANNRALREQAETEPLTGLGNRRRLSRAVAQHLNRAERYGERVALLLVDLDRFKAVNDELGHETGDAVIVACAEALRDRTRGYDDLVRLGGDEFVVVAPVPDPLGARQLAEDLRDHIAWRCNALLPADWGMTATIGVAVYPDAARDAGDLMRVADAALYRAKDDGPGGVALAESAVETDLVTTPRWTKSWRSLSG